MMFPKRLLKGLVPASAAVAALAAAPTASAQPNALWTGASATSTLWSDGLNWSAASPPSGPIGNLTFGDLPFCDVGTAVPTAACYTSVDNLGPDTVDQLTLGGGKTYQIEPPSVDVPQTTITLQGNGGTPNVGLSASSFNGNTQLANIGIPIVLGAAQEWDITGGGAVNLNSISGTYPLTLNLSGGNLMADDVDPASVSMSGTGELQLAQLSGSPELLPAVTINDAHGTNTALSVASSGATENGALTIQGTYDTLMIGTNHAPGEAVLHVNGAVTLAPSTTVEFDLDGNTATPGTDASQLIASGAVNLGGATISLWQAKSNGSCVALTPGTTFKVLAGGSLSGNIVVGGQTVTPGGSAIETLSTNQCSNVTTKAIVTYGTKAITATIAGAPAAGVQAPRISGVPAVGDPLRVSNGTWTAGPAPTFTYQWYSCTAKSCSTIAGATKSSYTLTAAELGRSIEAKVTASNSFGSASAFTSTVGPVSTATVINPGLKLLMRAELNRLAHPKGRRALTLLLKTGRYRTRFRPPAAGTLTVVWSTMAGRGKHAKHRSQVIANGIAHATGTHALMVTIWIIGAGHTLLRQHPLSLRTTAHERFVLPSGGSTSLTKHFTL